LLLPFHAHELPAHEQQHNQQTRVHVPENDLIELLEFLEGVAEDSQNQPGLLVEGDAVLVNEENALERVPLSAHKDYHVRSLVAQVGLKMLVLGAEHGCMTGYESVADMLQQAEETDLLDSDH
jgi:hypothetical protein